MSGGVDVLAFGAHPDDVEIGCGGILLRCADFGHSTGIVDLSRGEMASHGSPAERQKEADAASAVLGLAFRENLGLPDTRIDASSHDQVGRVVEVLRRRRPSIVLIPWTRQRHPDHAAAAALLLRAIFLAGLRRFETTPPAGRFVVPQALHYPERYRMTPSFVVDISQAWPRKLEAIRCHASQVGRRTGEDATLISSGAALEAIEARDRSHGSLIGTSHGEALRSVAVPGLVDPVKHFRDNPFHEPHAFEDGP